MNALEATDQVLIHTLEDMIRTPIMGIATSHRNLATNAETCGIRVVGHPTRILTLAVAEEEREAEEEARVVENRAVRGRLSLHVMVVAPGENLRGRKGAAQEALNELPTCTYGTYIMTPSLAIIASALAVIQEPANAQYQSEQELAIRRLGGEVIRDRSLPGAPIIRVNGVCLDGNETDLRALASCKSIRTLRVLSANDNGLVFVSELTNLTTLSLLTTSITDRGIPYILRIPTITHLDLSGTNVSDAGVSMLRRVRSLENLALVQTGVGDDGIADLAGLPGLKLLNVSATRVTDRGIRALTSMSKLRDFNCARTRVTDAACAHLSLLPTLQHLNATATKIQGKLPFPRNLRGLILDGCELHERAIDHICGLNHLEGLSLSNTKLNDAGILKLATKFPNLQTLQIAHTEVSATSLECLAQLRDLIYLDVTGTRIQQSKLDAFIVSRPEVRLRTK